MIFTVTDADVQSAFNDALDRKSIVRCCPVARAATRALGGGDVQLGVGCRTIFPLHRTGPGLVLTEAAEEFRAAFDRALDATNPTMLPDGKDLEVHGLEMLR